MKLVKVCRSKWQLPTYIRRQSKDKGELIHGSKRALESIERQIGQKLDVIRTKHTPTQWRFYFYSPIERKQ
jgi:hypothetical protein